MNENNSRPNILLVVMDSTRRDYLSCYGSKSNETPVIDELAEHGTIFEHAYATGPWTVPVHGSLFTGKLPSEHGAHAGNNYLSTTEAETLAGQLSNSGYDTAGFSTNPWLTEQFGYTEGFDQYFEIFPEIKYPDAGDPREVDWQYDSGIGRIRERGKWVLSGNPLKRLRNTIDVRNQSSPSCPAETMNSNLARWLADRDTDKPFFAFINYMDAHEPYEIHDQYLPEGVRVDEDSLDFQWNHGCFENGPTKGARDLVRQVYAASVSYLDDQIGTLFDLLKGTNEFENTAIVIMGDHGQSLGEHGYWGHGTFLYEELVNIPLIVRPPDGSISQSKISELVSIADIPRMLSEFAGFDFDDRTDHSLATIAENSSEPSPVMVESHGPYDQDDDLPVYVSESGYRSIYLRTWRGTRNLDTGEFDIEKIGEKEDLEEIDAERILLDAESNMVANVDKPSNRTNGEGIDNVTKSRLQDLGYI